MLSLSNFQQLVQLSKQVNDSKFSIFVIFWMFMRKYVTRKKEPPQHTDLSR